ncbi:tagaturonate reductase [Ureibacillus sinduriensis]|uniref:tagaturonate reductase n=1 Tax=Ureibacillus sinduriensis TaxID=561440 RepID=UPI00068E3714|nr:tagaturonate reductase [Ureibacillus sinduriensis]
MERLSRKLLQDISQYPEKVLQFGEGNFLRAFADWQIEEMNQKADFNGSVVVVQPRGQGKTEKLNKQDGLYTLYLQGMKDGKALKEHQVISSISRGIDLFNHYDEYLKLAQSPDLRFVISNTTEAGIVFDAADKLEDRPQKCFPAKLTAFLYERFKAFKGDNSKGVIVLPCELIEKNGELLKEYILRYAAAWQLEDGFKRWIEEANTFCNTMVDRIVPGYPVDSIDEITEELGYVDDYIVMAEQYHLWVIEGPQWLHDEFPAQLAGMNTLIVDDLTPYRTQKVRILNGAHTAMTPVAYLYGLDTVAEAVEHERVGAYIKQLVFEEIVPVLDFPKEALHNFAMDVMDRFRNPFIQHYLMSISLNSLSKFKTRNLPTLLEYYGRNKALPKRIVFALAALISFYKGKRGEEDIPLADDEAVLQLFHENWERYDGTFSSVRQLVGNVLRHEEWAQDLNEVPGLTEAVSDALYEIETNGMQVAIESMFNADSDFGEVAQNGCHSTK